MIVWRVIFQLPSPGKMISPGSAHSGQNPQGGGQTNLPTHPLGIKTTVKGAGFDKWPSWGCGVNPPSQLWEMYG